MGVLANAIAGDSIGLSAKPLRAGDQLAPAAAGRSSVREDGQAVRTRSRRLSRRPSPSAAADATAATTRRRRPDADHHRGAGRRPRRRRGRQLGSRLAQQRQRTAPERQLRRLRELRQRQLGRRLVADGGRSGRPDRDVQLVRRVWRYAPPSAQSRRPGAVAKLRVGLLRGRLVSMEGWDGGTGPYVAKIAVLAERLLRRREARPEPRVRGAQRDRDLGANRDRPGGDPALGLSGLAGSGAGRPARQRLDGRSVLQRARDHRSGTRSRRSPAPISCASSPASGPRSTESATCWRWPCWRRREHHDQRHHRRHQPAGRQRDRRRRLRAPCGAPGGSGTWAATSWSPRRSWSPPPTGPSGAPGRLLEAVALAAVVLGVSALVFSQSTP